MHHCHPKALPHPFLFPVSFDPYLSFVDYQSELEEEKLAIRIQTEIVLKEKDSQHKNEYQKLEKSSESMRKSLIEEHNNQIKNVIATKQAEMDEMKMGHEANNQYWKQKMHEQQQRRDSALKEMEKHLKEKFSQEKRKVQQFWEQKYLSKTRKLVNARQEIGNLKSKVLVLETMFSDSELQQSQPVVKRKLDQFEEYAKKQDDKKKKKSPNELIGGNFATAKRLLSSQDIIHS